MLIYAVVQAVCAVRGSNKSRFLEKGSHGTMPCLGSRCRFELPWTRVDAYIRPALSVQVLEDIGVKKGMLKLP